MDLLYQGVWIYLNSIFVLQISYLLTLRSLGSIHFLNETFADIAIKRRNLTTQEMWSCSISYAQTPSACSRRLDQAYVV